MVTEPQVATVAAYIAMNPVEAELAPAASEFKWSSHGASAAGRSPRWLTSSGSQSCSAPVAMTAYASSSG